MFSDDDDSDDDSITRITTMWCRDDNRKRSFTTCSVYDHIISNIITITGIN